MKYLRPICAFMCGPALVTIGFYLSGWPVERGENMAFAFTFAVTVGILFALFDKALND